MHQDTFCEQFECPTFDENDSVQPFPQNITKKNKQFEESGEFDNDQISTDNIWEVLESEQQEQKPGLQEVGQVGEVGFVCEELSQANFDFSNIEQPSTQSSCSTKSKKIRKNLKKSQKKQVCQIRNKKYVYMLPGESKNIPKNFIRGFKCFINENFPLESQQNNEVKKFLNIRAEKACKQTLQKALKSRVIAQMSKLFFGQLSWSGYFLQESKVDLEPYFRFNNLWF